MNQLAQQVLHLTVLLDGVLHAQQGVEDDENDVPEADAIAAMLDEIARRQQQQEFLLLRALICIAAQHTSLGMILQVPTMPELPSLQQAGPKLITFLKLVSGEDEQEASEAVEVTPHSRLS